MNILPPPDNLEDIFGLLDIRQEDDSCESTQFWKRTYHVDFWQDKIQHTQTSVASYICVVGREGTAEVLLCSLKK